MLRHVGTPTLIYMLQISCCSNGAPQSNTTVYIVPLGTSVVPGLVAVLKAYEWTQAFIITEENVPYLMVNHIVQYTCQKYPQYSI